MTACLHTFLVDGFCQDCGEKINKACSSCELVKLLSEFHNHKHMKDGRHSHCKACSYKRDRSRLNKHFLPEAIWLMHHLDKWGRA